MITTDRYAVVGDPIGHSKSPRIHAQFAAQTGQRLAYEAIRVVPGGLVAMVAAFRQTGGRGLNVTVPLKQEAWALCDVLSPAAERAGAVNTLLLDDPAAVRGDNTDGTGLVRDLRDNLGVALAGRSILVLGAGGAVRGVLGPLLAERPSRVLVANRTATRAVELATQFAHLGEIDGGGFDATRDGRFDVVVNGTAASLLGEALPLPDSLQVAGATCYDMMYAAEPTPFMRWAAAHGAALIADGLGMLVEQAAESFHLWRGVQPETAPVIEALRAELAAGE